MAKTSTVSTLDDTDDAALRAAEPAVTVVGANADPELSGERKIVTISPVEGDGGSDAVFVSVNGYAYQIPRDKPCSVPVEVIEVLRNARVTLTHNQPGGGIVERTVARFGFVVE